MERLELNPTTMCTHFLNCKDAKRIQKSKYKNSVRAKYLRRRARRKRKGFDDKHKQNEGVMYASCVFGGDDTPGPSKRPKLIFLFILSLCWFCCLKLYHCF